MHVLYELRIGRRVFWGTKAVVLILSRQYCFIRYYHDNRNFTRLLTMLSNEVVARARQLVGEHVLENLLAVGEFILLPISNYTILPCSLCSFVPLPKETQGE